MRIVLLFLSFVSAGWAKGIPDDVGIKILNGTEAYPGQFPYMAAIYANGFYQCGGALVDPSWILTDWDFARIPGAQVALGLHDFDNFENGGQVEVYDIEQIVQEPSGLSFLALVKLSRPVASGNPYIQTIALAPQDDYNYVGGNCYICGWGQTESVWSGGVLRYVQADVVSEDDCLVEMLDTPTEICVADSNTGLCNAELANPLACRRGGLTFLVGTLKYDSRCEVPWASRFHRITYFSDWVRAVIG